MFCASLVLGAIRSFGLFRISLLGILQQTIIIVLFGTVIKERINICGILSINLLIDPLLRLDILYLILYSLLIDETTLDLNTLHPYALERSHIVNSVTLYGLNS